VSVLRALVTRPAAQAADWVARLREAGVDAHALPLIAIAPPTDVAAVREAWAALPDQRLAIFVSPNAVERFMAARPTGVAWPPALQAGSTGPGTTRALRAAGVPAAQIVEPAADGAQFDSEALWQRLDGRLERGARVLVVRGDGGRDWLADRLRAHAAEVSFVAAYRREVPRQGAGERALLQRALDEPRTHVWCFSSSEAIDNLELLAAPGVDWSPARAIVSHARIAERARRLGVGQVVPSAPDVTAVGACIQSMTP